MNTTPYDKCQPKTITQPIKKPPPKRETAFSRPQQTFLKQCALPQSKKSSHRRNHVTLSRNALRKSDRERAPLPGPSPPHSSIIPQNAHPLQPGKNQILAADVGKFSSGLEGGDDGPPDNVPAFAVPVIGTNAPDVVEHNGLALVLPYI